MRRAWHAGPASPSPASSSNHYGPTLAASPYLFDALAAGDSHTCGRTGDGAVYCWGNYGGVTASATPVLVPVPADEVVVALDAGDRTTCVLTFSNNVYCWGVNTHGQLGDNSTLEHHSPVAVYGGRAFQWITGGGDYTCGLSSGVAYCWGRNQNGQLGTGDTIDRMVPAAVTRLLFKI